MRYQQFFEPIACFFVLLLLRMHNIINLRTQRITYFIPSVDVFCYYHFPVFEMRELLGASL